jgi:hypothetical protein
MLEEALSEGGQRRRPCILVIRKVSESAAQHSTV